MPSVAVKRPDGGAHGFEVKKVAVVAASVAGGSYEFDVDRHAPIDALPAIAHDLRVGRHGEAPSVGRRAILHGARATTGPLTEHGDVSFVEQLRQEVCRRVGRRAREHGKVQVERDRVVGLIHPVVCVAVGRKHHRGAFAGQGVLGVEGAVAADERTDACDRVCLAARVAGEIDNEVFDLRVCLGLVDGIDERRTQTNEVAGCNIP